MSTKHLPRAARAFICSFCIAAFVFPANADDTWWQRPARDPGNWFDANNWTDGVPGRWDSAHVGNGGEALIATGTAIASDVYLGRDSGQSGTVTQTGGTHEVDSWLCLGYESGSLGTYSLKEGGLSARYEYVGGAYRDGATGLFKQSGGTNTASCLHLGNAAGSQGTYELSGTGQLSATSYEYVGYWGTGRFTQMGGTNAFRFSLSLAEHAGSRGTYYLSEGQLSGGGVYVGRAGTGTFTQTGGRVESGLTVGYHTGSVGSYEMVGSAELTARSVTVGSSGTGTFRQAGGVAALSGDLCIGSGSTGDGTYQLSGTADLAVHGWANIGIHGTGTFRQTGGSHTVDGWLYLGQSPGAGGRYELGGPGELSAEYEYIGYSGSGEFIQTGGSNTVSHGLYVARGHEACGTYEQSQTAVLMAEYEWIGHYSDANGTHRQTGGTNTIEKTLRLGYRSGAIGRYELGGTAELSAGEEYVGEAGTGVFRQSGDSSNTTGFLYVSPGSSYELGGGTLQIRDSVNCYGAFDFAGSSASITVETGLVTFSRGRLLNAQGASLAVGPNSLTIFPEGFDPCTDLGSFTSEGLVHMAGQTLVVGAGRGFGGRGAIDDPVECQGRIQAVSDKSISINHGLTVSDAGSVDLGSGSLRVDNADSGLHGESSRVSAKREYVGHEGPGRFTQTGGTNTIAADLVLGYGADGNGTYRQSGGLATAGFLRINGPSVYELVGGTLHVLNSVEVNSGGAIDFGSGAGPAGGGGMTVDGGLVNFSRGIIRSALAGSLAIGPNSLAIFPPGSDPNAEFGSFSSDGLVCTAGSTILLPAGRRFTGKGTIDDHFRCEGLAEGELCFPGGFTLCGNGELDLDADLIVEGSESSVRGNGRLHARAEHIGHSGQATFTHLGGTNSAWALYLGYSVGSHGTYALSDTGELWAEEEYIGYGQDGNAAGTFIQSGGTSIVNSLYCGCNAGTAGSYHQSGGTAEVYDELLLGHATRAEGRYELGGSGELRTAEVHVGHEGTGSFVQTGGTHTAGHLFVAYAADSNGTYELGGTGALSAEMLYVGWDGTGRFIHGGGTSTLHEGLAVASWDNSVGTYELSGTGLLSAGTESIGYHGYGNFVQTGGTNSAGHLSVSARGRYEMRGGRALADTMSIMGVLAIGIAGDGIAGSGELAVGGNVVLDGALELFWVPVAGDANSKFGGVYPVLTWQGTRTGAFDVVDCQMAAYLDTSVFADGIQYDDANGALKVHLYDLLDGDADLDGCVGRDDFQALQAGFGLAEHATWFDGDFTFDGRVDFRDYLIWKANVGSSVPGAGKIPEPATLTLVALGAAAAMLRRRRRGG